MVNKDKLIHISEIKEEMILIKGSSTDYISKDGYVYRDYGNNTYYKKSKHINKHNGYEYTSVYYSKNKSRRVHILLAKAFIPNPNNYTIVGHKNNIKNDNRIDNLYWTTNQENTQKAFDDGLNVTLKGIESETSQPFKVIEGDSVIAVYGSISEGERLIGNISKSYLGKILKRNGDYKPRSRRYKYIPITKEEYDVFDNSIKFIHISDTPTCNKNPKVFRAINIITGEEIISDNQTEFANKHNLEQAKISNAILKNSIYNNWEFQLLKETTYKDASCYNNFMDTVDSIIIKNINTNEIREFDSKKQLKDYLGLRGHDILQYKSRNSYIMSEWEIIS